MGPAGLLLIDLMVGYSLDNIEFLLINPSFGRALEPLILL
jgi:hypothetical protein